MFVLIIESIDLYPFSPNLGCFSHFSFEYFCRPIPFLFFFWDSSDTNVSSFVIGFINHFSAYVVSIVKTGYFLFFCPFTDSCLRFSIMLWRQIHWLRLLICFSFWFFYFRKLENFHSIWFFFMLSVSLLRLSLFSFVLSMFIIACWSTSVMTDLKTLLK